jgi:hypothetical protein
MKSDDFLHFVLFVYFVVLPHLLRLHHLGGHSRPCVRVPL